MKVVGTRTSWGLFLAVCSFWSAWTAWEYAFVDVPPDPYFGLGVGVFLFTGNVPLLGLVARRAFRPRLLWKAFEVIGYLILALGLTGLVSLARSEAGVALIELVRPAVELFLMLAYLRALHVYLNRSPDLWP